MYQDVQRGVTFAELLLVLIVLAVLTLAGGEAYGRLVGRQRLAAAAQDITRTLQFTRSEALRRNQALHVSFRPGDTGPWCYGIGELPDCDCSAGALSNRCQLQRHGTVEMMTGQAADYPGIAMPQARFGTQRYTTFAPLRATAGFGTVVLKNQYADSLQVRVSLPGRVRICNPASTSLFNGYPLC
ncbi:MAG: GspH/FimT family pseudopilin [Gammaproteobacteria bacterium]|nr:GspH/FimT family pseudopilin [Gammaproteobacteria bacterium]